MPGILDPTPLSNDPQLVHEHLGDKPFFINFPFGYVANDVNWFEGAGIPFAAYDDFGRENAYPLVRVQATTDGHPPNATASNVVATVDTVLPISGEASCKNCHADPMDVQDSRTTSRPKVGGSQVAGRHQPGYPVPRTSAGGRQRRVGDRHQYPAAARPQARRQLRRDPPRPRPTVPAPCDITANGGNGNANCLTNKALVQDRARGLPGRVTTPRRSTSPSSAP